MSDQDDSGCLEEDSPIENTKELAKKNAKHQRAEYMKKLHALRLKSNEARKLNLQEVVEEDRRNKLPANWESKKRQAEWELDEQKKREEAESRGEDYERAKMLEETADEVERFERKKKKRNPDTGFSGFAAATERQYNRLTKQIKPNLEEYNELKEKMGTAAFPDAHSFLHGGEGFASGAGIDRMVADLEKQIDKRSKYSRRRQHFDEADIDYINERNKKFNEKADRFYGKYTAEIKQNLERGTAI